MTRGVRWRFYCLYTPFRGSTTSLLVHMSPSRADPSHPCRFSLRLWLSITSLLLEVTSPPFVLASTYQCGCMRTRLLKYRLHNVFCNLRPKNAFPEYPQSYRHGLKVLLKMHYELDLHLLVWLSWDAFLCPSMFRHGKAKAGTYIVNVSQVQTKAGTTDSRNNTGWVWHSTKRKNWGEGGSRWRMTDVRPGQRQRDDRSRRWMWTPLWTLLNYLINRGKTVPGEEC